MNEYDRFDQRCPSLSSYLAGVFYDGDGTDEELAREMWEPGSHTRNSRLAAERLVGECRDALKNIENWWKPIAHRAGKEFSGPEEARRWLEAMTAIWEESLKPAE